MSARLPLQDNLIIGEARELWKKRRSPTTGKVPSKHIILEDLGLEHVLRRARKETHGVLARSWRLLCMLCVIGISQAAAAQYFYTFMTLFNALLMYLARL